MFLRRDATMPYKAVTQNLLRTPTSLPYVSPAIPAHTDLDHHGIIERQSLQLAGHELGRATVSKVE